MAPLNRPLFDLFQPDDGLDYLLDMGPDESTPPDELDPAFQASGFDRFTEALQGFRAPAGATGFGAFLGGLGQSLGQRPERPAAGGEPAQG
jgi:hypothetical protein